MPGSFHKISQNCNILRNDSVEMKVILGTGQKSVKGYSTAWGQGFAVLHAKANNLDTGIIDNRLK